VACAVNGLRERSPVSAGGRDGTVPTAGPRGLPGGLFAVGVLLGLHRWALVHGRQRLAAVLTESLRQGVARVFAAGGRCEIFARVADTGGRVLDDDVHVDIDEEGLARAVATPAAPEVVEVGEEPPRHGGAAAARAGEHW
jgi:hypothetical protein